MWNLSVSLRDIAGRVYTHQALNISETLCRMNPYCKPESMPDPRGLDLSDQLDALMRQFSAKAN